MNFQPLNRIGRVLFIPLLALLAAFLIGALLMGAFGDNPVKAYSGLFSGALGSGRGWATTIRKMVPLILTGLSVAVAFKSATA